MSINHNFYKAPPGVDPSSVVKVTNADATVTVTHDDGAGNAVSFCIGQTIQDEDARQIQSGECPTIELDRSLHISSPSQYPGSGKIGVAHADSDQTAVTGVTTTHNRTAISGTNLTITGANSMASGEANTASGYDSQSFGRDNTSSGSYSFSANRGNTVNGFASAGFGRDNTVAGPYSIASGRGNDIDAGAAYATAFGFENDITATGDRGITSGRFNEIDESNGAAFGSTNILRSNTSFATGFQNTIDTIARGRVGNSFAAGFNHTITHENSNAMGSTNNISAKLGTAIGLENDVNPGATAAAEHSLASGWENEVSEYASHALGHANLTSGRYALASGDNVISDEFTLQAMGEYNLFYGGNPTAWVAGDRQFMVGNGSNTIGRSTAFTILKNGNVGINQPTPLANLDVVGTGLMNGLAITSDENTKKDIKPFTRGLKDIQGIKTIAYTLDADSIQKTTDSAVNIDETEMHAGVSAQALEAIMPEAVRTYTRKVYSPTKKQANAIESIQKKLDKVSGDMLELQSIARQIPEPELKFDKDEKLLNREAIEQYRGVFAKLKSDFQYKFDERRSLREEYQTAFTTQRTSSVEVKAVDYNSIVMALVNAVSELGEGRAIGEKTNKRAN